MADPPARNVMWQYGYANPRNVNLNELNCGGTKVCKPGLRDGMTPYKEGKLNMEKECVNQA